MKWYISFHLTIGKKNKESTNTALHLTTRVKKKARNLLLHYPTNWGDGFPRIATLLHRQGASCKLAALVRAKRRGSERSAVSRPAAFRYPAPSCCASHNVYNINFSICSSRAFFFKTHHLLIFFAIISS